MGTERRGAERKRPGGISYFQFEAGSGGIVLDASEKGLAFQAADAVQQPGPNRIWISPDPEKRIELNGDIVWMDRSRKAGGLLFIDPDPDTRTQIRDWLRRPSEVEVVFQRNKEYRAHPRAAQGPSNSRMEARGRDAYDVAARPQSSVAAPPRPVAASEEQPFKPRPTPHPPPTLPPLFAPDLNWQLPHSDASRGRFARSITAGFLIGVIVLVPVVLFEKFRPKVGDSLIHLGEKLNGNTDVQLRSSSSSSGAAQVQVPTQALPTAESTPRAPQQETSENPSPVFNASGQDRPQTPGFVIPSAKDTANHTSDTRAAHSPQDRSAEATRLWSAVGAGDSSAELELARLYLKGEGVLRNCEQAKILLRAAAKGGNWEARQQLQKLRANGCR